MSEVAFQVDDDDWFGAGSSFDSGEDLAAALLSLGAVHDGPDAAGGRDAAGAAGPALAAGNAPPASGDALRPAEAYHPGEFSTLVQPAPSGAEAGTYRRADPTPVGAQRSGSGWRIREGVRSLRRAEEALEKLRADAVVVTWAAAGIALRRARGDL